MNPHHYNDYINKQKIIDPNKEAEEAIAKKKENYLKSPAVEIHELPTQLREKPKSRLKKPRSSYTQENALKFVRIFDACIDDETKKGLRLNRWLDPDIYCMGMNTYYNRIVDALKWLCENTLTCAGYINKPDNYLRFRASIRFKKDILGPTNKYGIGIVYNSVGLIVTPDSGSMISVSEKTDSLSDEPVMAEKWRTAIYEFLDNENMAVLELIGIEKLGKLLTKADKMWIEKTLSGADILHEVGEKGDYLKAVK